MATDTLQLLPASIDPELQPIGVVGGLAFRTEWVVILEGHELSHAEAIQAALGKAGIRADVIVAKDQVGLQEIEASQLEDYRHALVLTSASEAEFARLKTLAPMLGGVALDTGLEVAEIVEKARRVPRCC